MADEGDLLVPLIGADGKVVAFAVTPSGGDGDLTLPVQGTDGKIVAMNVTPLTSEGAEGLPVHGFDNIVTPVTSGEAVVFGMVIRPLVGQDDHEVNEVGRLTKAATDIKIIGANEGFSIGIGGDAPVFAMQEFKGALYCCGRYGFRGTTIADPFIPPPDFFNLTKYDGSTGTWERLTTGDIDLNNEASTMVVWESLLVISGGVFSRAGSNTDTNSNGLVGWDGVSYVDLGATLAFGPTTAVEKVLVFQGNLTICGNMTTFTFPGPTQENFPIKVWDGANWNDASPTEPDIGAGTAAVVFEDELYFALDTGTIRKWSGSGTFTTVATITGTVNTMEVHNGKLCIGGNVTEVDSVVVRAVAEFDGTDWTEIGTGLDLDLPSPGAEQLLSAGSALFVVGDFIGNNSGDDFMGLASIIDGAADWQKIWDDENMDNQATSGFSLGTFKGKLS